MDLINNLRAAHSDSNAKITEFKKEIDRLKAVSEAYTVVLRELDPSAAADSPVARGARVKLFGKGDLSRAILGLIKAADGIETREITAKIAGDRNVAPGTPAYKKIASSVSNCLQHLKAKEIAKLIDVEGGRELWMHSSRDEP